MPTADELARLRIEDEAKKVISTTHQTRKLKQRELVGEAEDIDVRKDHVEVAKKLWSAKGTEGHAHGSEAIEQNIANKAKQEYEESIKKFGEKGQHEPIHVGAVPIDLKKKYDKPANVPALFSTSSIKQPKDSTPSNSTAGYSDGFTTIEKQEEKMVGTARHITTTGIDAAGRRVTKTKIILPEQVGQTKVQQQQGTLHSSSTESSNKLIPTSWDGKYYSLADIRQRKVDGIDKNNREQYLSPEDFEQIFKMSKDEFSKQPKWKRENMKRDLNLF